MDLNDALTAVHLIDAYMITASKGKQLKWWQRERRRAMKVIEQQPGPVKIYA